MQTPHAYTPDPTFAETLPSVPALDLFDLLSTEAQADAEDAEYIAANLILEGN